MKKTALLALVAFSAAASFGAPVDVSQVENVNPARPNIPNRTFVLTNFGAVGDGHTLNTEAFRRAIAAIGQAGGGRLEVPAGVYRTLPFTLCSSLDLHLDAGAVIQAPDTFAAMGLPDPSTLHSQAEVAARVKKPDPLISGQNLHDVAFTGPGTIDGNGALWWAWSERAQHGRPWHVVYPRPYLVVIRGCQRLLLEDVTLKNSPMFHFAPSHITDLTVLRVKIRAPASAPNTDGIDPGPVTNALIRDCDMDNGDDGVALKHGGSNILIEGCHLGHGHGISIGSETEDGFHDVLVRNCVFDGSDNGIRIKSRRGAGGDVENIRYTNIQMNEVGYPIVIDLTYTDSNVPNFKGDTRKLPVVHRILIDHVTIRNAAKNAYKFAGLPDSRITDITLRDVFIDAAKPPSVKNADPAILDHCSIHIGNGEDMP